MRSFLFWGLMDLRLMHGCLMNTLNPCLKEAQKWAKGSALHGFLICCFGNFFFLCLNF